MNFSAVRCLRFSLMNASKGSHRVNPPSTVVNADKFTLDSNAHLKRRTFLSIKNGDSIGEPDIVCEKALPQDEGILIDFYTEHFGVNEPINATLQLSQEERQEFLTALIKESTDNFLIRDADKIVGTYTLKKGYLNEAVRKPKKLADYGALIDAGPFKSRKLNIIATYLEASEINMYDKLKPPCIYFYGMMGGIHPKYMGKNLAWKVIKGLMGHLIDEGGQYYIGNNTGVAITKLYLNLWPFVDSLTDAKKLVDKSSSTRVIPMNQVHDVEVSTVESVAAFETLLWTVFGILILCFIVLLARHTIKRVDRQKYGSIPMQMNNQ